MSSNEIRDILTGNFSDPADRAYWEGKLAETERREAVSAANAGHVGAGSYVRLPNMETVELS